MTYRKLELDDLDAAAAVHRAALLHALPIFQGLHTPEEDRRYFREQVFPVCEVWGAFYENTLVGIVAFRKDWIDQLYVLPGAQRRVSAAVFYRLHAVRFRP
jgi:putative acetyltransferase